ncbi:MAG: hypothetical protein ABJA98_21375 [Acidobacteriota bacterium]
MAFNGLDGADTGFSGGRPRFGLRSLLALLVGALLVGVTMTLMLAYDKYIGLPAWVITRLRP